MTNRSYTAYPLAIIASRGENIADYLDTLGMSMDPEVLKAIAAGRAEIERGDVESLGQLM